VGRRRARVTLGRVSRYQGPRALAMVAPNGAATKRQARDLSRRRLKRKRLRCDLGRRELRWSESSIRPHQRKNNAKKRSGELPPK